MGFRLDYPLLPQSQRPPLHPRSQSIPKGPDLSVRLFHWLLNQRGRHAGSFRYRMVPLDRKTQSSRGWIFGIQRELPGQFVIDANFVTSWARQPVNRFELVPQYVARLSKRSRMPPRPLLDSPRNFLSGTTPSIPDLVQWYTQLNTVSNGTPLAARSHAGVPQFANVWVSSNNGTNRTKPYNLRFSTPRFARDLSLNLTYTILVCEIIFEYLWNPLLQS